MVFCNNCGKENKDFSKFCTGCGNIILTSMQPVHHQENMALKEIASNEFLCPQCGKQNMENAKFCVICGNSLESSEQPVRQQVNIPIFEIRNNNKFLCTQCGKQNKENAKFCVICGNSLESSEQPVTQQVNIPIFEIRNNKFLCTQCGKQNKESDKFCIVCGNRLNSSIQEPIQHQTNISIQEPSINEENEIHQVKLPAELNISIPKNIKGEEEDTAVVDVPMHKNKTVENNIPLNGDQPIKRNSSAGEDIPIEQMLPVREDAQNNLYVPVQKEEVEEQERGEKMSDTIPIIGENYPPNPEKKRNKIIFWTICILVVAGLGAFFLFGNTSDIDTNTSTSNNHQDIQQPKEVPKVSVGKITKVEDSTIFNSRTVNTSITLPVETIVEKEKNAVTAPVIQDINKRVPLEAPASPSKQKIINDLSGQEICNNLVFSRNAKVLSYNISKKTIQQCKAIISFKPENSDVKYTVTLIYKNEGGSFIYESNTCYSKITPIIEKSLSPSPVSPVHNVKGDLINYLKGKKIFGGIQYNDISEIIITKVGDREYYEDTGNTSYQVELAINNIYRKCQVNYTIDGKIYVNPLR